MDKLNMKNLISNYKNANKEFVKESVNEEDFVKDRSETHGNIKKHAEDLDFEILTVNDLIEYLGGEQKLKAQFQLPEELTNFLMGQQEELIGYAEDEDKTLVGLKLNDVRKKANQIINKPDYGLFLLQRFPELEELHNQYHNLKIKLSKAESKSQKAIVNDELQDLTDSIENELYDLLRDDVIDYDITSDEALNFVLNTDSLTNLKSSVKKTYDRFKKSDIDLILNNQDVKKKFNNINKEERNIEVAITPAAIARAEDNITVIKDELLQTIKDYLFDKELNFDPNEVMDAVLMTV